MAAERSGRRRFGHVWAAVGDGGVPGPPFVCGGGGRGMPVGRWLWCLVCLKPCVWVSAHRGMYPKGQEYICVWRVLGLVDTGFGCGFPLGPSAALRPVCLAVALSFALLPLRLLAFVQGAVALLTGDSDLVRVQAFLFMWPVVARYGWVLCSVAGVVGCCCSYWFTIG